MTRPIRIVIADDHPLFRDGLRALLESVPATEVVGEAATGDEAVQAALSLQPDVIVMDINMPDLNGIDATRQIIDGAGDVNVLVMTMHEDDEAVLAAIRAGARGYLLKGAAQDETLRAIRSVSNGEAISVPGSPSASSASSPPHHSQKLNPLSPNSPIASSRFCTCSHSGERTHR